MKIPETFQKYSYRKKIIPKKMSVNEPLSEARTVFCFDVLNGYYDTNQIISPLQMQKISRDFNCFNFYAQIYFQFCRSVSSQVC